jgi:hypothetical protein
VNDGSLPRSMRRDIEALDRAEVLFERRHGAETRSMWSVVNGGDLTVAQADAICAQGCTPNVLARLDQETRRRIAIVEEARERIGMQGATGDAEQ